MTKRANTVDSSDKKYSDDDLKAHLRHLYTERGFYVTRVRVQAGPPKQFIAYFSEHKGPHGLSSVTLNVGTLLTGLREQSRRTHASI